MVIIGVYELWGSLKEHLGQVEESGFRVLEEGVWHGYLFFPKPLSLSSKLQTLGVITWDRSRRTGTNLTIQHLTYAVFWS